MFRLAMPAISAAKMRSARKRWTSPTTSSYWGAACIVRGSPSMCISTTGTRARSSALGLAAPMSRPR